MKVTRAVAAVCAWLVVMLFAAVVTGPLIAQEVTGAIQGRLLDPDGKPVAYANVQVTSVDLQGTRGTLSNKRGFFQILALPVGSYTVRISHISYQGVTLEGVEVKLATTTGLPDLLLAVRLHEAPKVVVVGKKPLIDFVDTSGGGTLEVEDYNSLPVDRDYKSIITVLPGANQSYRGDPVNVGGSTGLENQYYIDGVNVTDTKTGGRATSLPYNFVREVDVKTGGYEAQYGRALGAVVNAITYSGRNDFEMDVFGFVAPGSLVMDARVAPAIAEQGALSYDVGARAGGPMIRDRLWYSAAINPRVDQVDKEIIGFGYFSDRTSALRFASKLTWQANSSTNLELSVFGDPSTRDQVGPLPSSYRTVTNPDALLHRVESGGVVGSLRATVAPSKSFLLQGSLARQWDQYSDLPAAGSQGLEAYFDDVEGAVGGGCPIQLEEDRLRTNLTLRGTLVVPAHTLVAGVDFEDAKVMSTQNASGVFRYDTASFKRDAQSYSGTFHNRSPAAYLQDSWGITDRFTLNPGLRWSGQFLVGASGITAQRITDEWQPRVGFSWQLGEKATQRIFGSYGRFYETLPTNIAIQWYVDYFAQWSFFSVDPREVGAVPDSIWDLSTSEKDWAKQIPGLHADNFDEFTLGYERIYGEATRLSLRATRRDLRSSFQWGMDPSTGTFWVLGTPGEGAFDFLPPPKREYTALEIAADGAWRQFRYRTSYVLSRTWGNYSGLYNSDLMALVNENPGGIATFWTPNQAENSTGFLPSDRTHVFKLSGAWTSRFGLETGAFMTYESGAPINDFAAHPPGGANSPSFLVPRGTAGRTPSLWNVDFRLGYDLPVTRGPRTKIQLDLLHVGNPRRATWVDELHYTLEKNDELKVNPQYKQPRTYQPPMAARLGIQASF